MANTYLTYTQQSPSTAEGQKFTLSMWVKKCANGVGQGLWGNTYSNTHRGYINFESTDRLAYYDSGGVYYLTNRLFRDTSAWYHIVVAVDTTQGGGNRIKFYINGVRETSFNTSTEPNQNETLKIMNTTNTPTMGKYVEAGTSYYLQGVISHAHLTQGYTYDATPFGETDATTGEWKIKTTVTGVTYGTNGFWWLKDTIATTDHSPNSNSFSVGGGTLTKTEDCPDNVFSTCSKEPMRRLSGTYVKPVLSNGNTTWDATGADVGATVTLSNLGATTGKYYMEAKVGGSYADSSRIGVGTHENYNGTTFFNSTSSNYVSYTANGEKNIAGTTSSYGASYTVGDIISVALDCDNNTVTFYKNGASQGAINIANNDNFKHFSCGGYDATGSNITNWICNFGNGYFGTTAVSSAGTNASGNGIFEFDVPTGYTALSTKGLNL